MSTIGFPPRRICCPVDFSDCSRVALDAAIEIARATGASLDLFHVQSAAVTALPDGYVYPAPDANRVMVDALTAELERWRRHAAGAGISATAELQLGTAWRAILDHVAHEHHDLLVMGTHGRGGLKHVFLGSVAERVVRLAPCPVLTLSSRHYKVEAAPHPRCGDLAHKNVGSVHPHDSLQLAGRKLLDMEAPVLPVLDAEGRVVGALDARNVLAEVARDAHPAEAHVAQAMQREVPTCHADDDALQTAARMAEAHAAWMLVLQPDGRLCGILEAADVPPEPIP